MERSCPLSPSSDNPCSNQLGLGMLVYGETSPLTQDHVGVLHPSWPFSVPLIGLGDPKWPQRWWSLLTAQTYKAPFLPTALQQTSRNRRANRAQGRTNSDSQGSWLVVFPNLSLCVYVKRKKKKLLHTWVMLYTGPARSRVSVSCTLLEGTGSSPSQGRRACVWVLSKHTSYFWKAVSCHTPDCNLVSFAMFQHLRSPWKSWYVLFLLWEIRFPRGSRLKGRCGSGTSFINRQK